MKLAIDLTRSEAALYLAWEFGVARANQLLKGSQPQNVRPCPVGGRTTFVRISFDTFLIPSRGRLHTKGAAVGWVSRIRQAVAYQEGRLGRPLHGGNVYVAEVSK